MAMKTYIFETTATMKEYNAAKWWIDGGIIPRKTIQAENVTAALLEYREQVENQHYMTISDNALKNKRAMYVDTPTGAKQKGFVITGKTDFQKNSGELVAQYIDLWINILTVIDTEF